MVKNWNISILIMEEINKILEKTNETMGKSIEFMNKELSLRAGKANPNILNNISVDYYGNPTPINQIASITTPDPKTVMIKPGINIILQ